MTLPTRIVRPMFCLNNNLSYIPRFYRVYIYNRKNRPSPFDEVFPHSTQSPTTQCPCTSTCGKPNGRRRLFHTETLLFISPSNWRNHKPLYAPTSTFNSRHQHPPFRFLLQSRQCRLFSPRSFGSRSHVHPTHRPVCPHRHFTV